VKAAEKRIVRQSRWLVRHGQTLSRAAGTHTEPVTKASLGK
jgi:hypothetical protein